jgi:LysM repeat protein
MRARSFRSDVRRRLPRTWLLAAVTLAALVIPGVARAGDDCEHEVKSGDTVSGIASRHGLSQRQLADLNPPLKKNPDLLRLGQKLDVCADTPKSDTRSRSKSRSKSRRCGRGGVVVDYEVASGDSLSKIAGRYDVSENAIIERNAELKKDPNALRIGQTLEICTDEQTAVAKKSKLCGGRTPLFQHEVVPGEHVGQIAGRYGVRRSDLVKWNASLRADANKLSVGQKIRVCPEIAPRERSKIRYTVAEGDNFGEIAERYGLTMRELERYQQGKLGDRGKLKPGQTLVVWVDGRTVPGFGGVDDDRGVLSGGMQLPEGRHYHVKWQAAAWGTSRTIRAIQSAVSDYKRRMPGGPKVHIGDISKRAGGKFPPHLSHQHGRDVDIGYVLTGKHRDETRFKSANAGNLDVARTWRLIKAFIDTGEVGYIFMDYRIQKLLYEHAEKQGASEDLLDELFQYPRGRGRSHGIIRHWRGHVNHFHVRFRK